MLKKIKRLLCFSVVFFAAISCSYANETVMPAKGSTDIIEQSPYLALENIGKSLFKHIEENKENLDSFPKFMETIVEEKLLPAIDYRFIAYKVLGQHLKNSTKEQRSKFVEAMKKNIIRSYASILTQYEAEQLVFTKPKPLNSNKIVAIPIKVFSLNKTTTELYFKLRKNKQAGKWLIFDVIKDGVSMLSTKQAEAASAMKRLGIDQATLELGYLK